MLKSSQAFVVAAAATALTLALRFALDAPLESRPTLVMFIVPILLSTTLGGLRAGLLATGLSALASWYFLLPPIYTFRVDSTRDQGQLAAMLLAGGGISALGEALRHARRRVDDANREQRIAHDAMRDSTMRFHLLVNNINDVFWIRSSDMSEVLYLSPAFESIWGRSVESLYANPAKWLDFIAPEDRERVVEAFAGFNEQPRLDIEYRIRRPDGEVRWVRVRGRRVQEGADHERLHVGNVTDVTEARRAEIALQESEERYRAVVDWSPEGIAVQRGGTVLFVNPATIKLMGASSAQDLVGRQILDFVHPEFQAVVRDRLTGSVEFGDAMPMIEERLLRFDGTWVDVEIQGTSILYEGLAATCSSIRDITERKRTAEALRTGLEEFQTLVAAVPQMVWITRPDGWNIYLNQQWTDYTGLSLEESLGHGWNRPFHPDDRQHAGRAWQLAVATVGIYSVELRLRRADGAYRWWLVRGVPLKDASGQILKWFGTCTDVHDLKMAELEISRSNRALKMLSNCNEALIRARNESELLERVCRIAVENGGYRMAWVGYAQDDAARSIIPLAHAGVEEGYLAEVNVSWNEDESPGLGPVGRTIRSGEAEVSCDLENDPQFAPWLAPAQKRGYRGVICLPLQEAEQTFGVLVLYSAEVVRTSPEELKLLRDLADDVAFGVCSLRSESERSRLQAALVNVLAGVSSASGTSFFQHLVARMAEAVEADAGFLAQLLPGEPPSAHTLASVVEGLAVHSTYAIEGTPCEVVLASETLVVSKGAADQFPECPLLAAHKAQGFVGCRLNGSSGQPLGTLFVLFKKPLKHVEFILSTLRIFAVRAASELERQSTDLQVREQAALLDIAHEAIQVMDLEGRIVYWNKGSERTFGWTAPEALDRTSGDLLSHGPATFEEARAALLASGEWHGEVEGRTKEGREISVEVSWSLVRDPQDQEPRSILAISTDVTEKKLLESRFLRAQRLEGIGTLAGGIAHDLNNVLAPIVMALELLKDAVHGEEALHLLDVLEVSAQRGAELVKQVVMFARGVEGQRTTVNPFHIMRDLLKVMLDTFPKSIDVRFLHTPDLWTITGDPTQLHQVLLNLSVNARDAMASSGTLTVSMENFVVDDVFAAKNPDAVPGAYVLVRVEDTGPGIAPQVRDRMFEPFFTTKETGKGTGLGLSTTLAIVKGHGGFLDVRSDRGQGARFDVYLPANTREAAGVETTVKPKGPPRGSGELILVVDDEPAIRMVAKAILEMFGYRVMVASDGAEAMLLFADHQDDIAVVLTDMSMPIMDGPALIKALTAVKPDVRVIASSGRTSAGGVDKAVGSANVRHFVPKPYTAASILAVVHRVLSEK